MYYYGSFRCLWKWLTNLDFIRVTDFANALKPRHKNGKKRK